MATLWSEQAQWQIDAGEHPHEAHYLKLDCSKAYALLNWQPRWNLSVALEKIVQWHKSSLQQQSMRDITLEQIQQYQSE
jgi:CDP-glucose 4,6-dehydratase